MTTMAEYEEAVANGDTICQCGSSITSSPRRPPVDDTTETSALSEITPVDDGPTEADIAVDAALGDLVRCAYHDR